MSSPKGFLPFGKGFFPIWGFPKMVGLPNKPMGFPTKNDHFEVFWGYNHHHLRKHPYIGGEVKTFITFTGDFWGLKGYLDR